jgi:hypothetical protein
LHSSGGGVSAPAVLLLSGLLQEDKGDGTYLKAISFYLTAA